MSRASSPKISSPGRISVTVETSHREPSGSIDSIEGLEGLEGYHRMLSPGPNETRRRNVNLDENGFISKTCGLSMPEIMSGFVRMPKESSKMITLQEPGTKLDAWEYPGWGSVYEKVIDSSKLPPMPHRHQLDVYRSTAIAGNDLLASVLYTTGICATACGQLAPFAMLLCCVALMPFRGIFKECGTAVPMNGGVYVALLNCSSKMTATFAASCSLISYAATAVVSAASCSSYAAGEFGDFPQVPVTLSILLFFAVMVLFGLKDSANVAFVIFAIHVATLFVLVVSSVIFIVNDNGQVLKNNWASPLPISSTGGIGMDLFLGYSVSLLGLTGFETSANYIEEAGPFETEKNKSGPTRKVSVFEKTIDRMWILVIMINPTIAVATLGVVDLPTITSSVSNILSVVGERAAGIWLRRLVSLDAILVLAGGVLTAYVGVVGLIKQLASDRCLPSVLLRTNRYTGTNHWIIIGYFLLCTVLYLMTDGDVTVLSGVFSIAFLMVLLSFGFANMKLKFCRPRLPRGHKIGWPGVFFGFSAMFIGLIGIVLFNIRLLQYFLIYLAFFFFFIVMTFKRIQIVKLVLYIVEQIPALESWLGPKLCCVLVQMKKHTVVFFAKTSELHVLNKAIIYARDNELCDRLIICHVHLPETVPFNSPPSLFSDLSHVMPSTPPSYPAGKLVEKMNEKMNEKIDKLEKQEKIDRKERMEKVEKMERKERRDRREKIDRMAGNNDSLGGVVGIGGMGGMGDRMNERMNDSMTVKMKDTARQETLGVTDDSHLTGELSVLISPVNRSPMSQRLGSYSRTLSDTDFEEENPHMSSRDGWNLPTHVPNSDGPLSLSVSTDQVPLRLQENLQLLDHMYPKTKVDLLLVQAEEFSPELVMQLSLDLKIQPSFMFIRCPGINFPYNIGDFRGVRTIMQ